MRQQTKSLGSRQLPWAAGSEQAPGRIAAMGGILASIAREGS